jgi:hypothetical protein
MKNVTTGARTSLEQSSFDRGSAFGTTGNGKAIPSIPLERSTAPLATAQPAYKASIRTEYGTPPPKWTDSPVNSGKDGA